MTAVYTEHFGLKEPPFTLAPDPRYLYASEQHREALAHLLYGVRGEGGFVLLTGEVGTGKTTVFRCLLERVPERTRIAFVLHPRLSVVELLATICDEFGIGYPKNLRSTKKFVDRINAFLLGEAEAGGRAIVVIDEAQSLATEVLEQLRLLTNLETSRRKLLQIILIGQPELREKIDLPEMRQLAQRITARYHLGPLAGSDVGPYVAHRLAVAGGSTAIIPSQLAAFIARWSGGVPRLINLVCDRSLLGAYSLGRTEVSRDIIRRAAKELSGERPRRGLASTRPALAAGLLAAAVAVFIVAGRATLRSERTVPETPKDSPVSVPAVIPVDPRAEEAGSTAAEGTRDLEWLFAQGGGGSREAAGGVLLSLWGIEGTAAGGDFCREAAERGLRCLRGRGNLADLKSLNRPALLRLVSHEGREFHVVVKALRKERSTILFEGGSGEMELRWFGEYTLLWKPPAAYRGNLHPGARAPLVSWLRRALPGDGPRFRQGDDVYDGELAETVRDFQRSRGLVADGIVGPLTLIHLNTLTGVGGPLLEDGEGRG